jgi:hypothetical protein
MRKVLKIALIPAAFALAAGAGLAATAAPTKADVRLNFGLGVPLFYSTPYYYAPYPYAPRTYYYAPHCYWDAYYGRVCY